LVCDFALAFGIALPRLRATSERLKGGYEKYWYGTPEDGLLRWEYWRTKDDNSGDELVHSADAGFPKGPTSLTPLPSPRPPDDEDEMTYYPNDVQMVNALGRIHVEGYLGHLQRARGIFDAPDPQQTDIHDPTRDGVYIDDDSISVWIGRYFAYFNTYTGDHERAIRAVLNDIYWSDEAQQKRGAQGGEPPTSPIQTAGRDFVR
jgi:hypothetical protein